MLSATYSCVEDEIMTKEGPVVEGSVLKLNEIMSKDVGDNPDWIEVYNSGTQDMNISGYFLNDKATAGGYEIPAGTIITAGGFYLVDANESGESISSGGEDVSLAEPDGTIIDHTITPDMSSNVGLTWAREIDGAGEWKVSSPTPASSNGSAANAAPILDASDLTELDRVYSVSASDADGIASVKLVYMVNDGVVSLDMPLVDNKYRTSVPLARVGDMVKFYVIAVDNTGLSSVYPENGTETPGEYTVIGGVEEVVFSEVETAVGVYEFSFSSKVYYTDQVDELRLYYLLPGESQDDITEAFDDKHTVKVSTPDGNGLFKASIPDLAKTTELRYYIRVEYVDGTKTYYPMEEDGAAFDHDLGTTWPTVTVGEIPVAPINGFSELTIVNEAATDLSFDVKVEYDNGDPQEVKFYYIINYNAATYVEGNDRVSITWAGDLPTADNMYDFAIATADLTVGDTVSWYIRAKDGNGDKMYYTFGKDADFDKNVIEDWNVVTKE